MEKRSAITAGVIGVLSIIAVVVMVRSGPGDAAGTGMEKAGPLDYPRGPHGARLLTGPELQLEVTIYETGVPPQFRVYPYDEAGQPLPAREVQLAIELHRLGGRVDRIGFIPEADYLRGDTDVEEPHSFDVKIRATRAGRTQDFSYSQVEGKVRLAPEAVKSAGIEIGTVGSQEIVTTIEVPGEIKPDDTRMAHVVPTVQGIAVEVLKKAGDAVERGELVAVLNSRELADGRSAYLAASRQVDFARGRLDREEALWKKKISAEQDYLEARRAFEESQLAKDVTAQKLAALGLSSASLATLATVKPENLSRFEIRAPLAGTVIERDVTVGEAVAADHTLFVIADLSSVWVEASIAAKDLGAVRQGQTAVVHSPDLGRDASGRISYLGAVIGKETRTAAARIVIPNPDRRWRPGLFVTVRLVRESSTVPLAVLAESIQTFRDWQVVFVKYGDWFEARPLTLGRSDGVWVEVLKGLSPGVQYATKNSFAIKAEIGKLGATHDH